MVDFALAVGLAIVKFTIIAVAIWVLDLALTMCLTMDVGVAFTLVVKFVSPLSGDESIDESSLDYGQIRKNQASLSMRLVVFPVTFIEAR